MAKNKNAAKKEGLRASPPEHGLSPLGKRLAAAGGVLVIAGFVLLRFADAMGRNLPALISPFLLVAGYAAIGAGLFLPPTPPPPPAP